jgi:type I restriction enzyme R subunit
VVLGLIFLKFASDKFEERRAELMSEGKEKFIEMVEFYTMRNVFFLPETSRWTYIIENSKQDDIAQMNARVKKLISEAISSDGVEEIFKLGQDGQTEVDIFDDDYLAKIDKIKLPNTKIKLLRQLLAKAIDEFKKVNKLKGIDFSHKMQSLVERYNERKEADVLRSEVLEEFTDEIIDLYHALKKEKESFAELGIEFAPAVLRLLTFHVR